MFPQVPLIICGSYSEKSQASFDMDASLYEDSKGIDESSDKTFYCPFPSSKINEEEVNIYSYIIASLLESIEELTPKQTLLITSPKGVTRSPSMGIILRAAMYDQDVDLAVASQIAQRPQALPSLTIISIGDYILKLKGELYQSCKEYLSTGLAVSSNGESFYYDPTGGSE